MNHAVLRALPAYLPSPTRAQVRLGPIPIRFYALCIIAGVIIAIWLGNRRWIARGGRVGQVGDIAVWAVPFGLVGGRLYHVVTDAELYFPKGQDWVKAFYIWDGGLGIPGAILLGGVGAWIGARRSGVRLPPMADALAPGIVLAQAVGRWGNWFNNELYGDRTTMPWGLKIYNVDSTTRNALVGPDGKHEVLGHFQPTFLYESLWCVGVAIVVLWADRRFQLGHGRAFALYVMCYTAGRGWIESLRSDYAHRFFGLRLNDWMSVLVFVGAAIYFFLSLRNRPGRETPEEIYWPGSPSAAADQTPPAEAGEAAEATGTAEPPEDADTESIGEHGVAEPDPPKVAK